MAVVTEVTQIDGSGVRRVSTKDPGCGDDSGNLSDELE
jgi:hypothetical protein